MEPLLIIALVGSAAGLLAGVSLLVLSRPGVSSFGRVLVVLDDSSPSDEEVLSTAARLAGAGRGTIQVMSMIDVPNEYEIDAGMEREVAAAGSRIERAKLIAGGIRVVGTVERVRRSQGVSRIVERALDIDAGVIVLGLRYRGAEPAYDHTIRSLMVDRPCLVVVVAPGGESRSRPSPMNPGAL